MDYNVVPFIELLQEIKLILTFYARDNGGRENIMYRYASHPDLLISCLVKYDS